VIGRGDRAAGKTLAELDLRQTTGATVVRGKAIPAKKRTRSRQLEKTWSVVRIKTQPHPDYY
jgi:hypothetical protein